MKKTFHSKYDNFEIITKFKPIDDSVSVEELVLRIKNTIVNLDAFTANSIDPLKELREVIQKFDDWLELKK